MAGGGDCADAARPRDAQGGACAAPRVAVIEWGAPLYAAGHWAPEMVRRAYEIGCMCNLNPSYVSAPNWTNGFAIVSTDAEETVYGVELVSVVRGVAVVNAIGKTVRA